MKTLSLNILDIVQNSIRALADEVSIEIRESDSADSYLIRVNDNGIGIPEEITDTVTNPYVTTRTKRKIGLGLPLLKYHTELTGGGVIIDSEPARGTTVTATFTNSHIDRQPLGDIVGILIIMIAANPKINFIYRHITDKGEYRFSSVETKEFLEVDTLYEHHLLNDIGCMIGENLRMIEASGYIFKEKV